MVLCGDMDPLYLLISHHFAHVNYILPMILITFATNSVIASQDALNLYFGGNNNIPPAINGTYSRQSNITCMPGDLIILECTADYPIKWKNQGGGQNPKWNISPSIVHQSTNHTILIRLQINYAMAVTCADARHSNSVLNSTVRLIMAEKSGADSVYAIRTSMTNMTRVLSATSDVGFFLWAQLRRQDTFKTDLVIRWWKTYRSPAEGGTGALVTKSIGYSTTLWTATRSPELIGVLVDWSPLSHEYNASYQIRPVWESFSGNYTCAVSDRTGTQYYSVTFQVEIIRDVKVDTILIFPLNDEEIDKVTSSYVSEIFMRKPIDPITEIQVNKSYILTCGFHGNPLSPANAYLYRMKFHCPPMSLISASGYRTPKILMKPGLQPRGLSSDGTQCQDFPSSSGRVLLLPPRIGQDNIILSVIVTPVTQICQYGCFYNLSEYRDPLFNDVIVLVGDNTSQTLVRVTVHEPAEDEIIIGDNVTLRCTAMDIFQQVYWKLGDRYVTIYDDPGPGYKMYTTTSPQGKILDLTVFNTTTDQSGVYTCRGERTKYAYIAEHDVAINLTVYTPQRPYFGSLTTKSTVIEEDMRSGWVDLVCDARGAPPAKIRWTKGPITTTLNSTANVVTLSETSGTLKIPLSDLNSTGLYECTIYNRIGENSKHFLLTVIDPISTNYDSVVKKTAAIIGPLVVLILALVITIHCRTIQRTRKLEALLRELKEQAKCPGVDMNLDQSIPVNKQIDSLLFDFRYEIPNERFERTDRIIGKGEFGVINVGYLLLDDGTKRKVAVKSPRDGMDDRHQRALLAEMKVMMYLGKHVNVLSLLGVVTSCMDRGILYAFIEYCEFHSLRDYLQYCKQISTIPAAVSEANSNCKNKYCRVVFRNRECPKETDQVSTMDLLWYSYQVANGMLFLVSKNIVHRDLALRNVLLTEKHVAKLADFGLALNTDGKEIITETKGYIAIKWQAIESITNGEFTKQSDVWSYGIVLWEIFTFGSSPYSECMENEEGLIPWLIAGNRMTPPDNCPNEIADLMLQCWDSRRDNRPSFTICQGVIENVAITQSAQYWQTMRTLLDILSDEYAISQYYNLNQIIALKRE